MTDVPVIFDFDEAVEAFLSETVEPTADNIHVAACSLGRNYYPALVCTLYHEGMLWGACGADVARTVVPAAWSAAEFPMIQLDAEEWRDLFDLAGYTMDGRPAERPGESLTLWRGALPEYRDGWSWTEDRDLAQWFAERPHNRADGRVYAAIVEPSRLLARISQERAGENEYVVDARGLRIE